MLHITIYDVEFNDDRGVKYVCLNVGDRDSIEVNIRCLVESGDEEILIESWWTDNATLEHLYQECFKHYFYNLDDADIPLRHQPIG